MVGETFQTIIADQFEDLRDGDRLYFENQGFDQRTLARIEQTSLSDIIGRDTDTEHIQEDAFVFVNCHTGTAGGVAAEDLEAPQLVIGSNGIDTLVGGPLEDRLVAGVGHQTLTGDSGGDTFELVSNGRGFGRGSHTNATITDFTVDEDSIEIRGNGRLDYHDPPPSRHRWWHGGAIRKGLNRIDRSYSRRSESTRFQLHL